MGRAAAEGVVGAHDGAGIHPGGAHEAGQDPRGEPLADAGDGVHAAGAELPQQGHAAQEQVQLPGEILEGGLQFGGKAGGMQVLGQLPVAADQGAVQLQGTRQVAGLGPGGGPEELVRGLGRGREDHQGGAGVGRLRQGRHFAHAGGVGHGGSAELHDDHRPPPREDRNACGWGRCVTKASMEKRMKTFDPFPAPRGQVVVLRHSAAVDATTAAGC